MTRPQHTIALLSSIAALVAFAPAASAANEDGAYRGGAAKPAARMMVVAPARTSAVKFSAARVSAARSSAARVSARAFAPALRGTCPLCGGRS